MARATLEIYDSWGKKRMSWSKNAVLYSAWNCAPSNGKVLETAIKTAFQDAEESGSKYWYNAMRIARHLIAVQSDNEDAPRFFPAVKLIRNSAFVWRLFLHDAESRSFELTCHLVEFDDRKIMERFVPIDWRKPRKAKPKKKAKPK